MPMIRGNEPPSGNGHTNLNGFVRGPASDNRATLRTALTSLRTEQDQLSRLEQARERAQEQRYEATGRLGSAQTAVQQAREREPQRLARAFAAGGDQSRQTPVDRAQTVLHVAQNDYDQIAAIEEALVEEIAQVTLKVQQCQHNVHAALAEVVCTSPELQDLYAELELAWGRLRGIRKAFYHIQHQLHGQMPQPLCDRWFASISLNPVAQYDARGPIPTDDGPVTAWSEALAHLLEDPDFELPSNV